MKKVSYAKWPKSCWHVQITEDEDELGNRTPAGLLVMHVADPDLRTFRWHEISLTETWVQSQFPTVKECYSELLAVMEEAARDHKPKVETLDLPPMF